VVWATLASIGDRDLGAGPAAVKRSKAEKAGPKLATCADRLSRLLPILSSLVQANGWWPESLAATLREGEYVAYLPAAHAL